MKLSYKCSFQQLVSASLFSKLKRNKFFSKVTERVVLWLVLPSLFKSVARQRRRHIQRCGASNSRHEMWKIAQQNCTSWSHGHNYEPFISSKRSIAITISSSSRNDYIICHMFHAYQAYGVTFPKDKFHASVIQSYCTLLNRNAK